MKLYKSLVLVLLFILTTLAFPWGSELCQGCRIDSSALAGPIYTWPNSAMLQQMISTNGTFLFQDDVNLYPQYSNGIKLEIRTQNKAPLRLAYDVNNYVDFQVNQFGGLTINTLERIVLNPMTHVTISSGNLGIGINSPSTKLEVAGTVSANFFSGNGSGLTNVVTANFALSSATANTALAMNASGLSGAINIATGNTVINVLFNGHVGIGQTAPMAKLDIAGGIKVTNDADICNAAKAGTIRWTGTAFQGCTGTSWTSFLSSLDGTTRESAGLTCKTLLDNGFSTGSGAYWIDPNGGGTTDAFQAYCDMTTDGGGWTLVVGIDGGNRNHLNINEVTAANLTSASGKGKYSDATINQIKLGSNPGYRLTCSTVTGYFPSGCTFMSTAIASGQCTAEAYSYPPSTYGTAQYAQEGILGLADGSHGTADRLIYGGINPLNGCDTVSGWGKSGTVYVR